MIISHLHKFVFTRPTKTGSSSAQAMMVTSGELGSEDAHTGYRNTIKEPLTNFVNLPSLTCGDIRSISPHPIPSNLLCDESGPMPLFGHLTPTEMLRLGLLSQTMIDTYVFASIIRDPIQRYISGWCFDKKLKRADMSFASFLIDIENRYIPTCYLGHWMHDHFELEGQRLPQIWVLHTETLQADIEDFLGVSVQDIHYKSNYRTDWTKEPIEEWLPSSSHNKLLETLGPDITFYQEVV